MNPLPVQNLVDLAAKLLSLCLNGEGGSPKGSGGIVGDCKAILARMGIDATLDPALGDGACVVSGESAHMLLSWLRSNETKRLPRL